MLTRRGFLVYMGMGTLSLLQASAKAPFPLPRRAKPANSRFKPIAASTADALVLADGFEFDRIASWGDALGSTGPLGAEHFGYDNDFTCYFPIDALSGGKNPHHGLLWVNHEFINPVFFDGSAGAGKALKAAIEAQRQAVGGTVLEVRREGGKWKRVPGSKYTRRFSANYPVMQTTGPVSQQIPQMTGTLANCSGGRTPWWTALSCEENFQLFNPVGSPQLGWSRVPGLGINETNYGWVVEVDPFGELPPRKHTSLGKFCHENAAMRLGGSGRLAVYMGDDSADQCFYKFVTRDKYDAKAGRKAGSALLENGTLYAADFKAGKWLPLDFAANPKLKDAGFKSQADVLLRTREAAHAAGATHIDRPEDCEIHPLDGSVYVALTGNPAHGNLHGQIVRLVEDGDDAESLSFRYEIFLTGGPQSGLSAPDNLAFDAKGNLWVACDISSSSLGKGAHKDFGNNGLFMVPTSGHGTGDAYQFASCPVGAEVTGPWFNENQDTLFLSIQHPGEGTTDARKPISRWPDGGAVPKPSVVAIRGF